MRPSPRVLLSFAFAVPALAAAVVACKPVAGIPAGSVPAASSPDPDSSPPSVPAGDALLALAESERSSGFATGSGMTEASLRERSGDWAGAVAAAFKELYWAYSLGAPGMTSEVLRERLGAVAEGAPAEAEEAVRGTARALEAFLLGRWDEARPALARFAEGREADSFLSWAAAACALASGGADGAALADYGMMRARYERLPAYWRFLASAKAAKGEASALGADAAERCIALAPAGPFVSEARAALAVAAGLRPEDGPSMLARAEIEAAVGRAAGGRDPTSLSVLLPLLTLPDNPYTLYALGAVRAMAADEAFSRHLSERADASPGRLAERLRYAARG